jgi:hypothetical protein
MLDGSHLDCLKDDVLVLNGEARQPARPRTRHDPPSRWSELPPTPRMPRPSSTARSTIRRAVKRALDLIGPVPDTQWDQIVVFAQMMSAAEYPPARCSTGSTDSGASTAGWSRPA